MNTRAEELFHFLKHGDDEHRAWLKEACAAYFNGDPPPTPRGGQSKQNPMVTTTNIKPYTAFLAVARGLDGRPMYRVVHRVCKEHQFSSAMKCTESCSYTIEPQFGGPYCGWLELPKATFAKS